MKRLFTRLAIDEPHCRPLLFSWKAHPGWMQRGAHPPTTGRRNRDPMMEGGNGPGSQEKLALRFQVRRRSGYCTWLQHWFLFQVVTHRQSFTGRLPSVFSAFDRTLKTKVAELPVFVPEDRRQPANLLEPTHFRHHVFEPLHRRGSAAADRFSDRNHRRQLNRVADGHPEDSWSTRSKRWHDGIELAQTADSATRWSRMEGAVGHWCGWFFAQIFCRATGPMQLETLLTRHHPIHPFCRAQAADRQGSRLSIALCDLRLLSQTDLTLILLVTRHDHPHRHLCRKIHFV